VGAAAPGARGHGAVLDAVPVSICTSPKEEPVPPAPSEAVCAMWLPAAGLMLWPWGSAESPGALARGPRGTAV